MRMENVMRKVLFAAAAATMFVVVSPAFAGPADDAEQGYSVYPSPGECHFVTERVVTQNSRVIYQRQQVCN